MTTLSKYNELPYQDREYFLQVLEFEDNEEKWALYLEILNNPDVNNPDYDILAIRVLKILEIAKIPTMFLDDFTDTIIKIIEESLDDDIRNFALITSKNFINSYKLRDTINDFLNTQNDNINLRFNALNALIHIENKDERIAFLKPFIYDNELKKYITEYI